jgi:hypothetical protein
VPNILIHRCIIADVKFVTYAQRWCPEIACPAGRLVDQFLFVGRIGFEGEGFLAAGHVHGGRFLQEAPDLIGADYLFLGIDFFSNCVVVNFASLTGFGA